MPTVTSRDGTPIAYSVAGNGPALILVDGALCSRAFGPMPGYAKRLADRFRVHWYDRRGRGESGDQASYAVAREVEDLGALIAAAGGEAYVFGASSGAALALHGALAGLPIRKLLMYEAPYLATPPGKRTAAEHAEALRALVHDGKRGAAVRYFMCDVVGMPRPLGWLFALFPMWRKLVAAADTLPYDLSILADDSALTTRARGLAVPTLVAGGTKSPAPLKDAVTRVAGALPGASVRWVEGATHNLPAGPAATLMTDFFLGGVDSAPSRSIQG